ncbi:MAG: UvrD-helicase domain-containing protein [Holophagaceae bacterium]|nr:UvrD-helicase domain-containing protein [Holophagaceae bacterium]
MLDSNSPPYPPLLQDLNVHQREAVQHVHGPLLILAGAGSGKTTVITRRIAWLIEETGIPPSSILAMTFTNKAAEEMRERVQRLVSVPIEQMWMSTFHSFCTRILRRDGDKTPVGKDFVIFDPSDQKSLIKQVLTELRLSEKQFHPRRVLEFISDFKNRCLLPEEALEEALDAWTRKAIEAYDLYQRGLKTHRACDFDDLLLYTERLLRNDVIRNIYAQKFPYILVDEYQDTNRAQYFLVQHLARSHQNLCVVGDEDQSIYGWRGADIRNILDFKRDFPEARQIKLEQNYRSTQKILDAASTVISNNSQRLGKTLWTDLGDGEQITFKLLDEGRAEADWVVDQIRSGMDFFPSQRVAILYRANWQSRQFEDALRAVNMPYKLVGGVKFYERKEVKDVLAYLRLISNPFDLVSFRRAISEPKRGVGLSTLQKIESAIPEDGTPLEGIERMLMLGELKGRAKRELAKFLELFKNVASELPSQTLGGVIRWVLIESGYLQALEDENSLESEGRIRNLEEFISAAVEAEELGLRLAEFLDRVTLASDADQVEQSAILSLMTIHCAKGLEFPTVYLVGLEDEVFPNRNARETEEGLEEERRLFYVAITRAQRKLNITAARRRRMIGQEMLSMPSRFLKELPEGALENPIRWGSQLYQSIQGTTHGRQYGHQRTSGGVSVATELQRIRNFFDRANSQMELSEIAVNTTNEGFNPDKSFNDSHSIGKPDDFKDQQSTPVKAWAIGTHVCSPRFGRGVITGSTGARDMLTYTIRFEGGEKRIVAKYGGLERESAD